MLAPRVTAPLCAYSLRDMETLLGSVVRCLHMHGLVGAAQLGDAQEIWDAIWTRMATILMDDLLPHERAQRHFFDLEHPFVEDVDAREPADVLSGRLHVALDHVAGGRRLRIGYVERLEIIHRTLHARLEALVVFERAARPEMAAAMKARLPPDADKALAAALRSFSERAGKVATDGIRDELALGMGRVHLWPGENEQWFAHKLQTEPSMPPMHTAPFSEEGPAGGWYSSHAMLGD